MKHLIRPLFAPVMLTGAALFSLPAAAQESSPALQETHIPSAAMVSKFRVEDNDAIYLRAGGHWYRGTFAAPCQELPWTHKVRFDTASANRAVDRDTTIRANGEHCRLNSLARLPGDPPATAKRPQSRASAFSRSTSTYLRSRKLTP